LSCFVKKNRKTFSNKIKFGETIDFIEKELLMDDFKKPMQISICIHLFFIDVVYNFPIRQAINTGMLIEKQFDEIDTIICCLSDEESDCNQ